MMSDGSQHRAILHRIARTAMMERGLWPDFSGDVLAQVAEMQEPAERIGGAVRDLRGLPWVSIDNDDSLDLDQLTVAQDLGGGRARVWVAVADVDGLVTKDSPADEYAAHNTTSVYTAGGKFPMFPDRLSTDLTSLNFDVDRPAMVVEMELAADGSVASSSIYRAWVRSQAKLAYRSVGEWLAGGGEMPEALAAAPAAAAQALRLQDEVAQRVRDLRYAQGALSLETVEAKAVYEGDQLRDLEAAAKNRATDIIEEFMIAANGVTARYLTERRSPSIRRVVHTPKRWDRIVEIAAERGFELPVDPDSAALNQFLVRERAADPESFPDLSLSVIKLLGPGEYVAEVPGMPPEGHFGLAVKAYTHSTAPNRRFSDLIVQRLLKASLDKAALPYNLADLQALATRCTEQEDNANKVERQVAKSAAALLLEHRIGEEFDAMVTGAAAKGTWVRLLGLPVEARVVEGFHGLDVGHRTRVQLVSVDVDKGYIDVRRTGSAPTGRGSYGASNSQGRRRGNRSRGWGRGRR